MTSSPSSPPALAPEPPPLVIPKLRWKFELYFYGTLNGKKEQTFTIARGVRRMEDAVAMAFALAEVRSGQDGSIHIRAEAGAGKFHKERTIAGSVSCKPDTRRHWTPANTVVSVRKDLEKLALEKGLSSQRWAWLEANIGGYSSERVERLRSDSSWARAFYTGDFAECWRLTLELEAGVAA